MTQMQVTMTVRTVSSEVSIVDIHGEVTGGAENALMDAYTQATATGARAIILNLSAMEYMNSAGIGLLVTLGWRAQWVALAISARVASHGYA